MSEDGNAGRSYTATANDVAEKYAVSRATVYNWVDQTDIPHRKAVGVIRFNLDEVDDWMRARNEPAPNGSAA